MKIDLSFYLEPPELNQRGKLTIWALAPLSMVSQQPGTYFRSELSPTNEMLYGLVENAAGWHFHEDQRKILFKGLAKAAKKKLGKNSEWRDHPWLKGKAGSSGSGYSSLLQFHLGFSKVESDDRPLAWDDLWSMLNKNTSISFVGGSRNYDIKLEHLITLSKQEDPTKPVNKKTGKHPPYISFGDKTEYIRLTLEELKDLERGKVNVKSLRPYFPQFYASPRKRGYIKPIKPWVYEVNCTPKVAEIISESMSQPSAPLYLGTNDGWIHAKWESYD